MLYAYVYFQCMASPRQKQDYLFNPEILIKEYFYNCHYLMIYSILLDAKKKAHKMTFFVKKKTILLG